MSRQCGSRENPTRFGSVLRVEEYLGGHREELRFELTELDPPRRMGYRILGPQGVLLPGGAVHDHT